MRKYTIELAKKNLIGAAIGMNPHLTISFKMFQGLILVLVNVKCLG